MISRVRVYHVTLTRYKNFNILLIALQKLMKKLGFHSCIGIGSGIGATLLTHLCCIDTKKFISLILFSPRIYKVSFMEWCHY